MKKEENEENKRLSQEVTQRFKEYPEILGISARAMSLTLGMSPDWLGGAKNGINCGALAGLLQKFPQVNAHYLLTGEGEPIIEEGKYMEAIVSGKVSAEMKKLRTENIILRRENTDLREELFTTYEKNEHLMVENTQLKIINSKKETK
ncbi:MAG: hypothetical protein IJ290_04255 [Bacteroidaceae bacterium]|nr:hypothetical protein [Bacteroidaceae bacterium]